MQRFLSLDFLRGLTIALMVIVNNPGTWGHVYPPLRHADWHGCTPTDLVFSFFLCIVGIAMYFSFSKFNGQLSAVLTKKILRRTALIFLIGFALTAYPFYNKDYQLIRIMGVLQRIGLAYGLGAFLCIFFKKQHLLLVSAGILLAYWALMWWGGGADPYSLEHNFANQIDLYIFTAAHVYKGFGIPFDPEGLFSTLPATCNVVGGYLIGGLIAQHKEKPYELVKTLALWGAGTAALGWVWGWFFPINKPLWTSSYVLFTVGLAMMFLAVCIWVLDIKGWQRAAKPFLVFGANPLFAFVLSGLLVKTLALFKYADAEGTIQNGNFWLYNQFFFVIDQYKFGSLLYALFHGLVIWFFCWLLYRRNIFIKI